ncbi:ATP-dependent DNA helicase [Aeromonas hydrophila]|uniref:ATP-dependent DNA helicase n=1 Tax=Aeromonas hydrophila TaxID=644 RepID=UPI002B474FE9|nr:ATP-dependent RecD-like DNA helicase [Aeromonas hydrophila]
MIIEKTLTVKGVKYYDPTSGFAVLECFERGHGDVRAVGIIEANTFQNETSSTTLFTGYWQMHAKHGRQFAFQKAVRTEALDSISVQRRCFELLPTKIADMLFNSLGFDVIDHIKSPGTKIKLILSSTQISMLQKEFFPQLEQHPEVIASTKHQGDPSTRLQSEITPSESSPSITDSMEKFCLEYNLDADSPPNLYDWSLITFENKISTPTFNRLHKLMKHNRDVSENNKEISLCAAYFFIRNMEHRGSTRISISSINSALKKFKLPKLEISDFNDLSDSFYTIESGDDISIQRRFTYDLESDIADIANKLYRTRPINNHFKIVTDSKYDPSQLEAINGVLKNNFSIIYGGPGHGKTTVVKKILNEFGATAQNTMQLALSGKSAQKLSESTGLPATTIHSALKIYNEDELTHRCHIPDDIRLIVIDEFSTIGIFLCWTIFNAISKMNELPRIILIGDPNQLQSIEPGSLLSNFLSSKIDSFALKVNHRTTNKLYQFISSIANGKLDLTCAGPTIIKKATDQELINAIINIIPRIPSALNINFINDIQILCPIYEGTLGINNINLILQEAVNKNQHLECRQSIKLGDKVLTTKNTSSYKNGEIGQVIGEVGNAVKVTFDDRTCLVNADDLELGYAISVHKFIGSESKAIVYISSFNTSFEEKKDVIYTMSTRAKDHLFIFTSCINDKINLPSEPTRHTSVPLELERVGL